MTAVYLRCIGHIPACTSCRDESLRGGNRHVCDDLCVLQNRVRSEPEGHRRSHEPKVHTCGAVLDDRHGNNFERVRFCGWGTCVQFLCPGCEEFVSGYGPAGCQCENDPCGHGTYQELPTVTARTSAPSAPAVVSRLRGLLTRRRKDPPPRSR